MNPLPAILRRLEDIGCSLAEARAATLTLAAQGEDAPLGSVEAARLLVRADDLAEEFQELADGLYNAAADLDPNPAA